MPILETFPQVSLALNLTLARRQNAVDPPAGAELDAVVPSLRLRTRLSPTGRLLRFARNDRVP